MRPGARRALQIIKQRPKCRQPFQTWAAAANKALSDIHAHVFHLCVCVRGTNIGREGRERRGAKCNAVKTRLHMPHALPVLTGASSRRSRCMARHQPCSTWGWARGGEAGSEPRRPWELDKERCGRAQRRALQPGKPALAAVLTWEALIAGADQRVPIRDARGTRCPAPSTHRSRRHFAFRGSGPCPCRVQFPAARGLPAAGRALGRLHPHPSSSAGYPDTHSSSPGPCSWEGTEGPPPPRHGPATTRNHGGACASQQAVASAAGTGLPWRNTRSIPMEACSYRPGCCSSR